jgi:hypothetical protein
MRTIKGYVARLALAGVCALTATVALAEGTAAIDGVWEGPWYRGMSSGKARFEVGGGAGSVKLTNSETFGDAPRLLSKVEFDGKTFRFEVQGGGGLLAASLKLNDKGDQMKGMGKYEGFGVRFELARVPEKP